MTDISDTASETWTRIDAPRSVEGREWEVFYRDGAEPLRHVGSVTAPDPAVAREQATALFGHDARALWLCPADEVVRLATRSLGDRARDDGVTEA